MAAIKGNRLRSGNQNQGHRGRGRNKFNNNGRFQCQICYRMGHIASRCYYSCPYTHEQNGIVERKHRHLVETGLSMLAHASMPLKF
ncbi:hypothetical protein ACOSP7_022281 [Xanthoceras sorbifolium]